MLVAQAPESPEVLSYLALRKAVGIIAFSLPFALSIPWALVHHQVATSISGYYYFTPTRNLFVGSLCALAMFMLCCRGYDRKDEIAGAFSSICAIGVAFFPTSPDGSTTATGTVHYAFAALLFSTLSYFCLVLFKMTAQGQVLTRKKLQRNVVYTVCGSVIIGSMMILAVLRLTGWKFSILGLAPTFCFETTSLLAFGTAWLIKGETFLKDENEEAPLARGS